MTLHEYFNVTSDEDRYLDASVVDLCKAFIHFFSKYLHAFVDSRRGFMLQALQPTDPSIFKVFSLFLGLRKSCLQYHNFHVPFLVSLVKMFGNLIIVWSILDIMPMLEAGEGASSLTHTNGIVPSTNNIIISSENRGSEEIVIAQKFYHGNDGRRCIIYKHRSRGRCRCVL